MRFVKALAACKKVLATYTGKFRKHGKSFMSILEKHLREEDYEANPEAWEIKAKFLALAATYTENRPLRPSRIWEYKKHQRVFIQKLFFENSRLLAKLGNLNLPDKAKLVLFKHMSCAFVASYAQNNYLANLGESRVFASEHLDEIHLFVMPDNSSITEGGPSWRRRRRPDQTTVKFKRGTFAYPLDGLCDLIAIAHPVFLGSGLKPGTIIKELLLTPWIQDQHSLWTVSADAYTDCVNLQVWNNVQREEFVRQLIDYRMEKNQPSSYSCIKGLVTDTEYRDRIDDFIYSFADEYGINVNDAEVQRYFGAYLDNIEQDLCKGSVWSGIRDKTLGDAIEKLETNSALMTLAHPKQINKALLAKEDAEIKCDILTSIAEHVEKEINRLAENSPVDLVRLADLAALSGRFEEFQKIDGVRRGYYYREYDESLIKPKAIALASCGDAKVLFPFIRKAVLAEYEEAQKHLARLIEENKSWLPAITRFFVKLGVHSTTSETKGLFCTPSCSRDCDYKHHVHPTINLATTRLTEEDAKFYSVIKVVDALVGNMTDSLIRQAFDEFSRFNNTEVQEIDFVDVGDLFG